LSLVTYSEPVPPPPERVPGKVSLYIDLQPGTKPDLDVIGHAAIAYVQAIKEAAFILNPGMDVTVELVSGTEGSLSLNTLLKSAKPDAVALKALVLIVIGWFASDLRTYGVIKFLDRYLPPEQRLMLSDDDIERIKRALQNSSDGKIAKEPVQRVYRELQRDIVIKGVGATAIAGERPPNIVPRDKFPELSQTALPVPTEPRKRKKPSKERVTLISPVLLEKDRPWRFYIPQIGEFNAHMADHKFLAGLLSGRRKIQMRQGIVLSVIMDTYEEKQEDVWVVTDRVITNVVRVLPQSKSGDLFAVAKKKNEDDD
jgi:hypothetical protein